MKALRPMLPVALAVVTCLTVTTPAHAGFGIVGFDGSVSDPSGNADSRAGGHPYSATVTIDPAAHVDDGNNLVPDGGGFKDIQVDLPAGFVGDSTAVPTCSPAVFVSDPNIDTCPASSQVGVAVVNVASGPFHFPLTRPVYNLEPPPGSAAAFGFTVLKALVSLDGSVRPSDYGLRINVRNVTQTGGVLGSSLTFWGVPADPRHDVDRFCQGQSSVRGCPSEAPLRPLLTNPTSCPPPGVGLDTTVHADSWQDPGVFVDARFTSHDAPGYSFANPLPIDQWGAVKGTTGCDSLPFHPSISVQPDATAPDAPTGLSVDLTFPQDGLRSPTGRATAHLKRARVTLPEGMTISPSAADGLQACTDAEIGIGTDSPVTCPDGSKIGTVTARTPLLEDPIEGDVRIGSQESDDPESGRMFRIFLVLEDKQRGLLIKLPGEVRANRATGRLETVFDNTPQLPVSTLSLRLKTGPRAPLATPPTCGPKVVDAELTSWAGPAAHLTDTFTIDCPAGSGGFSPAFSAGTLDATAGAFSPFVAQIDRPDRQQYLSGVSLEMPGGLLAKLKGVPL